MLSYAMLCNDAVVFQTWWFGVPLIWGKDISKPLQLCEKFLWHFKLSEVHVVDPSGHIHDLLSLTTSEMLNLKYYMVLTQQHQIAAAASKAFSTCSKAVWNSTRLSLTKGRSCSFRRVGLFCCFFWMSSCPLILILLTDTCIIVTATCILQILGFSDVQLFFAIHPHHLYSFVWPLNQFSHVRIYLGHLIGTVVKLTRKLIEVSFTGARASRNI